MLWTRSIHTFPVSSLPEYCQEVPCVVWEDSWLDCIEGTVLCTFLNHYLDLASRNEFKTSWWCCLFQDGLLWAHHAVQPVQRGCTCVEVISECMARPWLLHQQSLKLAPIWSHHSRAPLNLIFRRVGASLQPVMYCSQGRIIHLSLM